MHIVSQTKNSHNLRRNRDDKVIFSYHSVHLASQTDDNVTEDTVVHIHAAFPDDLPRINSKLIALLDMVVQKSRQEIVGGGNCMEITGKVQIQILHRHNLRVSAAGCTSLDSKTRSKGRLS